VHLLAADLALRLLLGALAIYHLGMGLAAATSLGATDRLTRTLYGAALGGDARLRHAVRMVGLLAAALGGLLAVAALEPSEHREVIVAVAALQGARAAGRVAWRRDLAGAFGIPSRRNAIGVAVLLAEVVLLVALLPPAR
jgi:hypothetical protein